MLTASSITLQFAAKPLFENVNVKFGDGNRYGLIGANGCGKSTFMKILAGELEPTAGNVSLDPGERMAWLRQDQFGYEDTRVLDVVLQGHAEMWRVMQEKDAIYMNPEATEEDYLHAAELEGKFGEMGGYDAEARAGELLLGAGIPTTPWDWSFDLDEAEAIGVLDCVECGTCSYVCPAHMLLVQRFRVGKQLLRAKKQKEAKNAR